MNVTPVMSWFDRVRAPLPVDGSPVILADADKYRRDPLGIMPSISGSVASAGLPGTVAEGANGN